MKFAVTGAGGFLGRHIVGVLKKRGIQVETISLRRGFDAGPEFDLGATCSEISSPDVLLNLVAVKRPRNRLDHFLNRDLPVQFAELVERRGWRCRYVHISTMNVLFPSLSDSYTEDKRAAERALVSKSVIIMRPGLVWSWDEEGEAGQVIRYLRLPLPKHPFPRPGNKYRPVHVEDMAEALVVASLEPSTPKVVNFLGDSPCYLWDLAKSLAHRNGKRLLPVSVSYLAKPFEAIFGQYYALQQLIEIDRANPVVPLGEGIVYLPFHMNAN